MTSADELLRTYQPVVRFDSHEAFFAHDVRAMADDQHFQLTRADQASPGAVIVDHSHGLDLEFLTAAGGTYPNGAPVQANDHFALMLGGSNEFANRIGDYRAIERGLAPGWRDFVFGRAVSERGVTAGDDDGELWLQYWYFYIYNDAQFGGRVDLHEGDWEMVQFRLLSGIPTTAVYAQHAYAEERPWTRVEQDPAFGCPVVYSGRGSHASYFEAGLHRTYVRVKQTSVPLWWDAADGRGRHVRQRLVPLEQGQLPGWVPWDGHWGGTRPHLPPLDGESPQGPRQHDQWGDPAGFAQKKAITHERRDLPTAPAVAVRRSPPGLKLRFDFTAIADPPDRLVVTATAGDEPPITETLVVDTLLRGVVETRGPLDAPTAYTVDVSTVSSSGIPTKPSERPIRLGPVRPISVGRLLSPLFAAWDALWLWIGARLARRVDRRPIVIDASDETSAGTSSARPAPVQGP
jgi:hypothetical protein